MADSYRSIEFVSGTDGTAAVIEFGVTGRRAERLDQHIDGRPRDQRRD